MLVPLLIAHGVATAGIGAAMYGTFVPSCRFWGRIITRGPSDDRKSIALTFDDGPTEGPTERILDHLNAAGVKASFFVIGRNCIRWPKLVRRMHDEGHLVANHTWDHLHSGWIGGAKFWRDQVNRTSDTIADIIGVRPAMFRPPMGHKTCFTLSAAKRAGCKTIGWTERARDGGRTTEQEILARFAGSKPGDILLLHDGVEPYSPGRDPEQTVSAVPLLILELKGRGLEAVRLDDLLQLPAYQST
jgi:peptidoglycan/xylan/chitin deacetylase (PgdA/CDA1 family)